MSCDYLKAVDNRFVMKWAEVKFANVVSIGTWLTRAEFAELRTKQTLNNIPIKSFKIVKEKTCEKVFDIF